MNNNSIAETLFRLMGGEPLPSEGIAEAELAEIEASLGRKIPFELREFYRLAGKNERLMDGFNRFAQPGELEVENGRVLFLEENQSTCFWGYEADDPGLMVHMQPADSGEWFPEVKLSEFLPMLLYYQCVQGAYEYCGLTLLDDDEVSELLEREWEPVVEHNGLSVAWKQDCLLWWLSDEAGELVDDCVYFSARTSMAYEAHKERYALEDL